ncbi:PREDICTED: uncharacterized protein LOC109589275 [Amphimedon queenslandica]|uniref:C-terminal of Roc (COR) domain-containing protein n=1 Tax=Amphimedon queenslandica TaxID=400682 RepID=A0AAN0JVK3_AMPQE|nr:PREDICTED: uncharacterized protein LOC109589275 [Amphimedon queenslandica]|eukprot:XP_019860938.1 PREDICTED: uncharacterized protein LOC109589275 [Amphimedon queenslandica]
MHGLPGAGKTCSRHLLLNEDPPSSTDSTSIACPAVKATRISVDDKNKKWERVEVKDLYNQLASHLKEVPNETELEQEKDEAPLDLTDIFDSSDEDESDDETDDQPTEIKPIEKKPVKIKQTEINPTETEVVKEVLSVHETGKSKKFSTNWVYFIDSGGQPAYRELLPLFTRAAALNIITIDLTKGLDEKCEFQYRISQNTSPINTELKYSNRDIIHSTIASEAMLNPIEIPYVTESDMPKHSHYLILGTRKELISEEKLKEMNKSLIEYKVNKKVIPHNKRQDSIIFPVDTLLPAGSKEREEASIELCTAISNCGVEMTIVLPIRLLTFEISLQIEAKKKKRSFLTKEEVIEIGKSLQLDKKSDIDVALQYLHNVTIILYFHEVLPTIIFVDPKPILDVFSRLIAITYVDHNKLHLIANPTPSPDERRSLIDFGLFKEGLLKVIGKQIFSKDFQPSHMITLLRHLHIIAKVENRKEGDYFFPCALPSYDKLNPASTEIQPLLIAWEINNSGTKSLAIPQGLFPLTIVHLLEREDVDFNERFYRCLDAMSLCVNDEHH